MPEWSLITGQVREVPYATLQIEADSGHIGYGFVSAMQPFDAPLTAIVQCVEYLGALVVGEKLEINPIMHRLERALFAYNEIKAGFETALYDLCSQCHTTGLAEWLGGALHPALPVSRLIPLSTPDKMAALAKQYVSEGHRVLKVKLNGNIDMDVERIKAVRLAVGPAIRLTADANGSYQAKAAIRAIARMDDFDITLFEQPVGRHYLEGLKLVTQSTNIMIEADESAGDFREILELVRTRSVDSVCLRIPKLGGVAATVAAANLCHAFDIQFRLGVCFLPSHFQAMCAHVASTLPSVPLAHEIAEHQLFTNDPFEQFPVRRGFVTVPTGVGVGLGLS